MKEKNIEKNLSIDKYYSHRRDEYIKTLEMSFQLLQREVENLRQQLQPQSSKNISKLEYIRSFDVSPLIFNDCKTSKEVINKLHDTISSKFEIIESNVFFYSSNRKLEAVSPVETETTLTNSLKRFVEGGIIDWAIERKNPGIIPNIIDFNEDRHIFFIIVPLFLHDNPIGIFFALTTKDASFFDDEKLSEISAVTGYAAIAIDNIRSREEILGMNTKLSALNNQMLESSKLASIGGLASSFSQEIHAPIKIIEANIQLLQSGLGDSNRRYEIIKEQLRKIEDISNRLEILSPTNNNDNDMVPVDIVSLIEDVILFSSSQLQRDGIIINKEFEMEACEILGSKSQLEQVILNLLLRSRDSMSDGGLIVISVFPGERNKILINITDNGIGIPTDDLDKIFDPGFKHEDGKYSYGLYIIKNIIKQHRGRISVFSEHGKGTTVKIALPEYIK